MNVPSPLLWKVPNTKVVKVKVPLNWPPGVTVPEMLPVVEPPKESVRVAVPLKASAVWLEILTDAKIPNVPGVGQFV